MRMRGRVAAVLALAALTAGCGRLGLSAKSATTVLDVKRFELKDVEQKDLPGAVGGKAVLFARETSKATREVPLKAGKYQLVVYVQAPDTETDAIYVWVEGTETRVYPDEYGKIAPALPVAFTVKEDKAVRIALAASEV